MTYEIKKGVPAPAAGTRKSKYPFAQMEVGDCFDARRDLGVRSNGADTRQNVVSACARGYAKRYNPTAKFAVRLIDENTIRCWRVA